MADGRKNVLSSRIKSANVKLPELFFGYFLGPVGALLASGIFASFLNKYWTEVLFLGQLTSGVNLFLQILPLASTIFIVAGNLIAGQIIEKTKSKQGKARPWILLSAILLGISCITLFVMPSDNPTVKMVLTAISYNLYYAVAYPLYNTANSTLIPVSTRNGKQRGLLASAANMAGLTVMGAGTMVFPIIVSLFLHTQGAWTIAFLFIGALGFISCILQYLFTRERVTEENFGVETLKEKIPLKKQLNAVASNKFWWIIIIFYLLFQFSGAIKNLSMTYFCDKVLLPFLGMDSGAMMSVLAILGAIPMAVAVVVIWPLSNKFGKQIVTLVGMVIGVIGGVLAGIFYDNFVIVGIGVALKCLGSAPACYMILAMISDVLDNIEAKSGFRCDGLTMSIYSSIMVAATPIGQAIFNLITNSGQNEIMISVSYIWIETIAYALCAILIIGFYVEKNLSADREVIRERQKEICLAEGKEWIEPEERLRIEEEKAEQDAEIARIAELKAKCAKKGLNFDEEEAKYQAKHNKK